LKKLLYFNRANFGVKGHDASDDGGFVILQMASASSRNCEVWATLRQFGGQSDVLQIAQGRRTSGGEPAQMFRPLATDGSVQAPTSIYGVAHKKGTAGCTETLIIIN
jgi:hypothetical protein